MLNFFKKKEKKEDTNEPEISIDPNAIEIFINSDNNKYAELYCKNGIFTYQISEKFSEEFDGNIHYYWCPTTQSVSFFDTREKAIKEILSIIEPRK